MLANLSVTYLVIVVISILISLVIHEFMHAFVSFKLGDTTAQSEGRLSFNPLSHIDPVMTVILPIVTLLLFGLPVLAAKPVPFNPGMLKWDEFGAALVALAGPLSNLVLAFLSAVAAVYLFPGTFFAEVLGVFTVLNVTLFVFNLLPIPPLDGSRVLYAFAPEPVQRFMEALEPIGLIIVFGLVFVADLGGMVGNINTTILNLLPH